jgi:hypothetical protein
VVEFLKHLIRHIPGPMILIWDRLSAHKSRMVQDFIAEQHGRIHTEYVPAYAPDLNPVEYLWGHWKQHELPNVCPKDWWELNERALNKTKQDQLPRWRTMTVWLEREPPGERQCAAESFTTVFGELRSLMGTKGDILRLGPFPPSGRRIAARELPKVDRGCQRTTLPFGTSACRRRRAGGRGLRRRSRRSISRG